MWTSATLTQYRIENSEKLPFFQHFFSSTSNGIILVQNCWTLFKFRTCIHCLVLFQNQAFSFSENDVQGRLKMAKMCLSEANFQLIFYFKLVSTQKYKHQSKVAFWDFHTKHSQSLAGFWNLATPGMYF